MFIVELCFVKYELFMGMCIYGFYVVFYGEMVIGSVDIVMGCLF